MPENWKTYKLEDLTTRVTVGFVGSMAQEYVENGVPMLRSQNIKPFTLDYANLKYISPKFHEKISKSSLSEDDVAIVRTGNPGTACVIPEGIPELNCSDLVIATPDKSKIDPHFLCFYFNSIAGNYINSELVGAVQQHFNVGSAKKMEIKLPKIEEQHKIVSILKAIQDKIELNLQMNKTLEEMTMALYKHWFVNFGPFQDGEFVDSELGEIPKGWEVKKLPEIAKNHNRKRKPLSTRERIKRQGKYPYYGATKILDYIDEYKFEGEFILLAEDGTVKTERDTPYLQFVEGKFWVSNHAHVLSGKGVYSNEFLYLCLNNKNVIPIITGAVQLKINKQNLESSEFVVPPEEILKKFEEIIIPKFKYQKFLSKENENLINLRDTLLPKLISGEVRVKDAEKTLSEVL